MSPRSALRLIALLEVAGTLAVSSCTVPSPIMVLPQELHADAEVFGVSGRRTVTYWSHDIRFGPYRTRGARVGGRGDYVNRWGVLDDNDHWEAKQSLSFVLEGAACPHLKAQCLASASRHVRKKAVGIGAQNGDLIDRRVVEDRSEAKFECTLAAADARSWRMVLTAEDPSGFGGVLTDDRGAARAQIRAADRRTDDGETYSAPSLGFIVQARSGDVAAVERADEGKVIFERRTPQDQRCALATVAAALLLWEPLR